MTEPSGSGSFSEDLDALVGADPALAAVVAQHGPPVGWSRPPGFASLVLLILEQQVSLASAAATYRTMLARLGTMSPTAVLAHPDMRADGVSRQKERYLRALASAVESGTLDLIALSDLEEDEVRARLTALPGIGRWTADVYLLICLGRRDLWPVGDRALQVAAAEALGLAEIPDPVELTVIGERWRPRRSMAARVLWHGYLGQRGRAYEHVDL